VVDFPRFLFVAPIVTSISRIFGFFIDKSSKKISNLDRNQIDHFIILNKSISTCLL
jgi:hypothetical protein